jgi:TatD DNase family protein
MLYDAHCHLQDSRLRPHWSQIAEILREIGVAKIVVNGTREQDWPHVLELASEHDFVVPSLGLHPWYIKERTPAWFTNLEKESPVAVGEIGLDRWMRDYDFPDQQSVFIEQLDFAARTNRPVSIHCLKAWGTLLGIVSTHPLPNAGFLLHSYGGPAEMIPRFAKLGAYFSISGHFAHPRKVRQLEVFRLVPLERLLVETDAPDMAPPPELIEFSLPDESLNHPGNLRAVYQFAARLRGIPLPEFIKTVERNFQRLFGG